MTPAEKNHIQIRCPSCSQKFKVGSELMGRTVECGACEHRFEVTDDVIAKGEKFYPGERNASALAQFNRIPGPSIGMAASEPALPGPHLEKGYYSPITRVSVFRIVMGWVGVLILLSVVGLLSIQAPGFLGAEPLPIRLTAALVGGMIGVGLLAFANPRTLKRTVPIAAVFAAVLLSIPFVFHAEKEDAPVFKTNQARKEEPKPTEDGAPRLSVGELREKLGSAPLEVEIRRLKESGSSRRAYGIWLRDMNESNKLAVRDYLIRASGSSPSSIIYSRDDRDYLMVLTGVEGTLEDVAAVTKKIAVKQQLHPELELIEVRVDASVFLEGPLDKLTDRSSPAFYDLNKRELDSIQLDRVGRAVRRLSDAEPKIYREDITRQLIALMSMEQLDNYGDIAKALLVWAENPTQAGGAALVRLKRLHEDEKRIPPELVALLAKSKTVEALPIVKKLWTKDLTTWEPLLGQFGDVAEPIMLDGFNDLEITLKHSGVRILGLVGTKASLPALEGARTKGGAEINVLIEKAVQQIESRG